MQKRGRAVETQKLKRTMKSRKTATVREAPSCSWGYIKLTAIWFLLMSLDAFSGARIELMWPCWMLVRSMYESMQRRSSLVHLSSQTTTFLFVCVTATSDLICYLFIPVRLLIFLATTYVWMNLVWHVNGGFLATVKTVFGEKTQAAPVIFLWAYFVVFEIFCRMRCDYLIFLKYLPFAAWLEGADGCLIMQGMQPGFQQAFNAFFSAHCIGYPLIIISFNIKYYYKEWRLRLQQGDVSDTNESLFRLLADAIPMDFDATRMYRRADYLDDECLDDDFLEISRDVLLPIEAPPASATAAQAAYPPPKRIFGEEYPHAHLSSYEQLRLLGAYGQTEKKRAEEENAMRTARVLASVENGGDRPASNGTVVHRREKNARPSISSKSSRGAANGRLQSHSQQQSTANGQQRRMEKEREEEGGEDWPDSSSSEAEVQLNRRHGTRAAPLVVRAIVAVATSFLDVLLLAASVIPFLRHALPARSTVDGRSTVERGRDEQLHAQHPNGKTATCSPHATPPSQLSTPPSRKSTANGTAKANGVVNGLEAGGTRRRTGDHSHSNGTSANGGRSSRSNGLGVSHHDVDVVSGLRDVSRESARTQHSEESEQSNRGRTCGAECGKLASEVARLRAEVRHVRQAEEAARLAASNCIISEKNVTSECSQMRKQIEQLINKVSSVERQREKEGKTAELAERKAAESAARAAELELELQKERVARREERERGREKSETVSETQQLLREKEAAWEREGERLRIDSRTKDEVIMEMQAELTKLRVVAKNAVEAEDLRAELSLLREKTLHLEENLAEENKLKQELFRALRNTQAERDRATRQYDYSASSSFYPLSPTLGSPGSNGTHSVLGSGSGGYGSSEMPPSSIATSTAAAGLSCAAEQAFAGNSKHSFSFSSPATHSFLSLGGGGGQHTLFEPLPMPPSQKNIGFPLVGEELHEDDSEPFYAQNCGKFGAPSPASARTTTS